jgi:hypothetical protein
MNFLLTLFATLTLTAAVEQGLAGEQCGNTRQTAKAKGRASPLPILVVQGNRPWQMGLIRITVI